MKRFNGLMEPISDPENLRMAFYRARKGKRYSKQVLRYQANLHENLRQLRDQILATRVVVGHYHIFRIFDPKERQICAPSFPEQVLHHGIMNIAHPYFERKQIHDSYACRIRKGTYAGLERAKRFTRRYEWYLKLDVQKFFASIHHGVLKAQLEGVFKDEDLLVILDAIIASYADSEDRGLPIGNLTSQYFANHYLSGLDHFIKENLGIKAYVRYMDDMVLWHREKEVLRSAFKEIEGFVNERLLCALKPKVLNRSRLGLSFLGYRVLPYHLRLTQQSKRRFVRKIRAIHWHYNTGEWDEATCQRRAQSLIAFTNHANAFQLRKEILSLLI